MFRCVCLLTTPTINLIETDKWTKCDIFQKIGLKNYDLNIAD